MERLPIVVGLGEILWDCFPDFRRPGGAPANVAFHASQLGARGVVCSRVGKDALGQELLEHLRQHDLSTQYVAVDPVHETSRATIRFDDRQQHTFTIHENCAWDFLAIDGDAEGLMREASAICFGTLAQRSETARATIYHYLRIAPPDCLRVFDVNLRAPFYDLASIERSLRIANVLKLNDDEVNELARMFDLTVGEPVAFAAAMRDRFDLELVAITRGGKGCVLECAQETIEEPGTPVEVVDTVGAGDAFSAALIVGLIGRRPLAVIAREANHLAAQVASHPGATPRLPRQSL